jgi:pimeloyl-ACP methyl ester carboxylesterase
MSDTHTEQTRGGADGGLPEALAAPRRTLTSSQRTVSFYVDDSGGGTPLVLVHSINAAPSAFEMKPLFERYRGTRPVYAPDLPGFGLSDRSRRRYSPQLYADALLDLLDQAVGAPADMVAFSLGAEFAARAALAAPGRIRSLALLSPTGLSRRTPPQGPVTTGLHGFLDLPGLGSGLYQLLVSRRSIRYFLGQSFVGEPPEEMVDYAYHTSHQPGARHAPLYFLSGQLFTPEARTELYEPLELPVLVLHDRDANVSFEHLDDLVAQRPNWRAERIQPTLGIPHWEKPEETAAAMERFWAELG